jgi:DNA-binding transcriptional LysR family regulator
MKLTHRHIEVFRAIMEAPSLTAAAAIMGTSQPTLSRELAEVEGLLGYQLFLRVGRRLQATAPAITLFREIQRSYIGLNHILATAAQIGKFEQGQLSVICVPGLAHALLPGVVRRYKAEHRSVGISLVPQEPPLLEEWLTAQRHDLGLTEIEAIPSGTRREALFTFDEICVLPAGHPLLEREVLHPSDFEGETFISQAPNDPIRHRLDEVFRQYGVNRVMSLDANDSWTICCLVREGLGVTIVNPLNALYLAGAGVELRRFAVPVPFVVQVVVPEYRPHTPLVGQFVEAIRAEVADLMERLPGGHPVGL